MCEFSKWLRRELQLSGGPATTIARVEIATARTWGGSRVYLGRIAEGAGSRRRR